MSNTNVDGIVTPDEGNSLDPAVWSAAMADSISNGIGVRLAKQEQSIGCLLAVAPGTRIKFQDGVIVPYEVLADKPCFVHGMTLSGGIFTVAKQGIYNIMASASIASYASWGVNTYAPENEGRSINLSVMHNGVKIGGGEVEASKYFWATAHGNANIECMPGDTLYCLWHSTVTTGANWTEPAIGALVAEDAMISTLSIAFVSSTGS